MMSIRTIERLKNYTIVRTNTVSNVVCIPVLEVFSTNLCLS